MSHLKDGILEENWNEVEEEVNAIFDLVYQVKHQLLHWVLTFFSFSGFYRK
jgi:hypothetical protein